MKNYIAEGRTVIEAGTHKVMVQIPQRSRAMLGITGYDEAIREDEENIRMFAAAHDLMAALELIEVDKDGDGFICAEAMSQVRAAIAKAKG